MYGIETTINVEANTIAKDAPQSAIAVFVTVFEFIESVVWGRINPLKYLNYMPQ